MMNKELIERIHIGSLVQAAFGPEVHWLEVVSTGGDRLRARARTVGIGLRLGQVVDVHPVRVLDVR